MWVWQESCGLIINNNCVLLVLTSSAIGISRIPSKLFCFYSFFCAKGLAHETTILYHKFDDRYVIFRRLD